MLSGPVISYMRRMLVFFACTYLPLALIYLLAFLYAFHRDNPGVSLSGRPFEDLALRMGASAAIFVALSALLALRRK